MDAITFQLIRDASQQKQKKPVMYSHLKNAQCSARNFSFFGTGKRVKAP